MQLFVAHTPIWLIFIIITFISIALVLFTRFLGSHYLTTLKKKSLRDNYVSMISSSAIILVALMIAMLWQNFINAKINVTEEVNALSRIVVSTNVLSEEGRQLIMGAVKKYSDLVIHLEWPLIAVGKSSPDTEKAFNEIYYSIQNYQPRDKREEIIYDDLLENWSTAYSQRNFRLSGSSSVVPKPIFYVLLFILFLGVISETLLLQQKERKINLILLVIVALVLSIDAGLIISLDFPFSGEISISNEGFANVLKLQKELNQAQGKPGAA